MLNILATFCGLCICLLLYYFDKLQQNIDSSQYKIFKIGHNLITINLIISLFRILFANYLSKNYIMLYTLTLLFHLSNVIILYILVAYCISLIPKSIMVIKKYIAITIIPYLVIEMLILTSPITKLVYYLEGMEIRRGPLSIVSFFTAFLSLLIILVNTFVLHNKEISSSQKYNISLILFIPTFLLLFEFFVPEFVLSGFSYACNLLIIYNSFFTDNKDDFSGYNSKSMYNALLKNSCRKKKNFTIFYIKIENLEFLKSILPSKESKLFFSKLNRHFANSNSTIETFYLENNLFALVSNISNNKVINNILQHLKFDLDDQVFVHKVHNIKLEYYGYVVKSDLIMNKFDDIEHIENFILNNKPKNDIFIQLEEKDKRTIEQHKTLVKNINDIVDNFDLIYNINEIDSYDTDLVEVYYQPILNLKSNKFESAEALMRLNIKELGGIVYPNLFIPYLEEKNLIHRFSCIVLAKVCKFIKDLEKVNKEIEGISVNFSLLEFLDDNFENDIVKIVNHFNVNPNKIHIEITETVQIEESSLIREKMLRLKQKGFKFYLDDFGTGYSNLSKLVDLPFNVIKFDKSLVDKSLIDDRTINMISCLSSFMVDSHLKILFEGIEDENSENIIKKCNATFAQGYKYSKPIPTKKVIEFF